MKLYIYKHGNSTAAKKCTMAFEPVSKNIWLPSVSLYEHNPSASAVTTSQPTTASSAPIDSAGIPSQPARQFPDISTIEVFDGHHFRRWQDQIFNLLNKHGVAWALTVAKEDAGDSDVLAVDWQWANRVCLQTIISTIDESLFRVYAVYKEAASIWKSMTVKYAAAEDGVNYRFAVADFLQWEMDDDEEVLIQINDFHRLLDNMAAQNIRLSPEFVVGSLIYKLPKSWNEYKVRMGYSDVKMSLNELINDIAIEEELRRQMNNIRRSKTNPNSKISDHALIPTKKPLKKKKVGNCFVCGKVGHYAAQCRHRKGEKSE
ncbi:hypothetical protein M569_13744 [Genlisea aurea]|uniref:CCHC-type domain-containing protein n=1 Tax=Genlisea aurea TaxID=192259 RepID=S8DMX6_9LAMI|nr:hypothetical protein M569_13744 [Genlisea aurea]